MPGWSVGTHWRSLDFLWSMRQIYRPPASSRHELAGRYLGGMSEPAAPYTVPSAPGAAVILMQCPIAGFQFHGGESCWARMRVHDRLALKREPGNAHDPRAITVQWQDVVLGYVPRQANYALSQMMDRGTPVEGRVLSLRAGADAWQRIMIEVLAQPQQAAPPRESPKGVPPVTLRGPLVLSPPRLQLVPATDRLTSAQVATGHAVLRDCVAEVLAALAHPVIGTVNRDSRTVRLWGAVDLEIGSDGRGLSTHFVQCRAAGGPATTLDLKRPLGEDAWLTCFLPALAAACTRHGLARASMGKPLHDWITTSLRRTFAGYVDLDTVRKAALDFLAPDPLARSLANRIFPMASCDAFNWLCNRVSAIALCAVEQPAMLPFLRIVEGEPSMSTLADPLAALHDHLLADGLEPAAWRKLARWGFGAFEAMGEAWWKPIPIARFANLLHRLDVQAPPPRTFVLHALQAARHRDRPYARLDFERHPLWFMRALLHEVERARDGAAISAIRRDLPACLDWLVEARPQPDPNQQRAGWPWILDRAADHLLARELALSAPWIVPVAEMAWGPYRVVAISCAADLAAEAAAMKNCLATYEDACRSGEIVVFSIRQRSTGVRVACFAAEKDQYSPTWELIEVAGKMNAAINDELERIGHAMVVKLNGGRGREVPPF